MLPKKEEKRDVEKDRYIFNDLLNRTIINANSNKNKNYIQSKV